ncbi:MAG: ATP synthase F1 subunit delta [Deltaproteobacteria bacterium]|nr:ATP synthase F1 subunit delta [Deltaproteobacteria bacterium]PWB62573.1 MAG: ATP synthase F1 subunit delta [Deltaproteobacteria bacterium]
MTGSALARRYARALLDIGREEGQVRRVLSEVERFAGLLDDVPVLREVLEASHVNRRDKQAALEGTVSQAGFLPVTMNFLRLLVDKRRMNILPQILTELRRMVEELEGVERVEVISAAPLPETQREFLRSVLSLRTGKRIELEEKMDPAVLGGMVVKLGSTVYDGSVRTQLVQIRENLQKG